MVDRYNGEYDDYDEDEEFDNDENEITEFKRYFFVDYENVNRDGLNGIARLCSDDCVKIYYSESAETLTWGLHRRINASKAHFEYIKVQMPIKNAVDCQILFDLRDVTRNNSINNRKAEYFIVSEDSDFDKPIEEFKALKLKVKKIPEICKRDVSASSKNEPAQKQVSKSVTKQKKENVKDQSNKREAQIRSWYGKNCKKKFFVENKEAIIQAMLKSTSRQAVNNTLMKSFTGEQVSEILKVIQPYIKDWPGK